MQIYVKKSKKNGYIISYGNETFEITQKEYNKYIDYFSNDYSDDSFIMLLNEIKHDRALQYSLKILSLSETSANRLKLKLREKFYIDDNLLDNIITYLAEKGYLKDESNYIENYCNLAFSKLFSKRQIYNKLRGEGLDLNLISSTMEEIQYDEQTVLYKLVSKTKYKSMDPSKLLNTLIRRGFKIEDAKRVIKELDYPEINEFP